VSTGSAQVSGGYKDLPHRLWLSAQEEAGLMVMEGSQPSKKWAAAAETAEGLERNPGRVPLSETCGGERGEPVSEVT